MTAATRSLLEDAAGRLRFGVGVWIGGEPQLTAQLDWDRRPQSPSSLAQVEALLFAHRKVSSGLGGALAQAELRRLAAALDPRNCDRASGGDPREPYLSVLVDLTTADAA